MADEPAAIYARPMTDQREFFVSYAGEMTPHDREALTRTLVAEAIGRRPHGLRAREAKSRE
jgi:hypothetical protein